jgi:hypothetical protein
MAIALALRCRPQDRYASRKTPKAVQPPFEKVFDKVYNLYILKSQSAFCRSISHDAAGP